MRKITITYMNMVQSQQSKRNGQNRNTLRKYGRELKCAKCQKELKVGETAYRTSRKYFCVSCGEKAEI